MKPEKNPASLYTSKIIKASALVGETQLMLAHWDLALSVTENCQRLLNNNILGKTSAKRTQEFLTVFRARYTRDADLLAAMALLAKEPGTLSMLQPIYYFCTVNADVLLADFVDAYLGSALHHNRLQIVTTDVIDWLMQQVRAGKTTGNWAYPTSERIAQGLLATLRDFGVLEGKVKKTLAHPYLPETSFALMAYWLTAQRPVSDAIYNHQAWRSFFLERMEVERLFLRAHQLHLLTYQAAGRVIRLEFPAQTIEEYVRVLIERTH